MKVRHKHIDGPNQNRLSAHFGNLFYFTKSQRHVKF